MDENKLAIWNYFEDNGVFRKFSDKICEIIEIYYQNGVKKFSLEEGYEIDLDIM